MSLIAGTTLGPYEVISPLGAGGMGEVYQANDTRLGRTVAIKVLPEHLAEAPALRERFEREARAVSSLNHPHICTLFDVGEHDGVHFLVMEHIEGETLAHRLKKGALPLHQALELGAQMADALDKAHGASIVHRDLKPGNVMLTKTGVKLLDFGLAKTREGSVLPTEDSEPPTQNKPLTDAGTILGTIQYMAPEQLEGKEVDARADLFALGAILFEMVTGRRAFEGESQASLISAIMSTMPPPVSQLQAVSPPALDRVVEKCLEKDPDRRWHSAHDLMEELRWIASLDSSARAQPTVASHGMRRYALAAVILAAVALAFLMPRESANVPVYRVDIAFPQEHSLVTFREAPFAISPDGETIVYSARHVDENDLRLFRRSLREFDTVPLAATEGARAPFFSPDGEWIGFFAGGYLRKISVDGGAPLAIAETGAVSPNAVWGDDGRILFSIETRSGLRIVSANGGEPEAATTPRYAEDEYGHRSPQFLPGGKQALFTVRKSDGDYTAILTLATGEWRVLHELGRATRARWISTGHLLYVEPEGSTLMVIPFDLEAGAPTGAARRVVEDVLLRTGVDDVFYDVAPNGNLVYAVPGAAVPGMAWLDRDGNVVRQENNLGVHPRVSPSGDRVAVDFRTPERRDVWVLDERGARIRLTREGSNEFPIWSPDGRFLVLASTLTGSQSIYWTKPDGSAAIEPFWIDDLAARPTSWSSDGRFILLESSALNTQARDVWLLPVELTDSGPRLSGDPTPLHRGDFDEGGAVFSPNGRWIAYVSNESGQPEVFVESFPGADVRHPVSTTGGTEPMWSPDGTQLFYRNVNSFVAVNVETEPEFRAGDAVPIFEAPDTGFSTHSHYDVAPDGQQFVVRWDQVASPPNLRLVLNWFRELERLTPDE